MATNAKNAVMNGFQEKRNTLRFVQNAIVHGGINRRKKMGDCLRYVSIYFEEPSVSSRYFKSSLTSIRDIFRIGKVELKPVRKISDVTIKSYSPYPRILMTHEHIKMNGCTSNFLDGIGLSSYNIALVRYQRSFTHTMFLLAHEIGHIVGMPHCSSHRCIMGVYRDGKGSVYAWKELTRKRLSSNMFCPSCKSFLHSRRMAMLAGG